MKEIEKMNEKELAELIEKARQILEQKKQARGIVKVHIETEKYFDPRKHGHAYCAFLRKNGDGKVEREWVNNANKIYMDNKNKYYQKIWDFDAHEGDVIEARVAGSWKNDYRDYYVVEGGEAKEISREEAFRRVLAC